MSELTEMSEELAALVKRADQAAERAQVLLAENERWRELAVQQLEYMFELGAEFRKPQRIGRASAPGH